MIVGPELDESGDQLHWIITLEWGSDGASHRVSTFGLMPADMAPTRYQALKLILGELRSEQPDIPENAAVTFFSVEPNKLSKSRRGLGGWTTRRTERPHER